MVVLHTSDWHLGRSLGGISLLEDQAHIMTQIVDLARDSRADLVLIIGDVYERSSPQPEAVQLLDEVLSRLILDCKTRVILLPGQHDNPSRLSFGSWLMDKRGLHVVTSLEQALSPIIVEDADGPVHVNAIPYLHPASVARQFRTQQIHSYGEAGTAVLEHLTRFRRLRKKAVRGIVAGYFHLEGGQLCGAERPLGQPDESRVQLATLNGIAYAALGYLHTPQRLGEQGEFCYAGSPLAYTFEEADQTKVVNRVELGPEGQVHIESLPLSPRRRLHRFQGTLASLIAGPSVAIGPDDLVKLSLTSDTGLIPPPLMERLRRVYPNLVTIERQWAQAAEVLKPNQDVLEIFRAFYREVGGGSLDEEQEAILREVLRAT